MQSDASNQLEVFKLTSLPKYNSYLRGIQFRMLKVLAFLMLNSIGGFIFGLSAKSCASLSVVGKRLE